MSERIREQKSAVSLFATEFSIPTLDSNQWSLMEGTIALLQPFQEFTKLISSSESPISEVIPAIRTISRYLGKASQLHAGVGTMKEVLLANMSKRFDYVDKNNNFTYATFLDPRFKIEFLKESVREITKVGIIEEAILKVTSSKEALPVQENAEASDGPTLPKRGREEVHSSLWDCFSEVISATRSEEDARPSTDLRTCHVTISDEVESYLAGKTNWL
jgi:hypothetical protein